MLATVLGTDQINIDVTSNAPGVVQTTHHFNSVSDLVNEIVNARIWGGLHYRGSALVGVELGHHVAQWTLQRYFLPSD